MFELIRLDAMERIIATRYCGNIDPLKRLYGLCALRAQMREHIESDAMTLLEKEIIRFEELLARDGLLP